jgi:GTP-binding protein
LTSPSTKGDPDTLPLVAIVGRPNVGKSTLFNRFVRKRKAITDPTPGVTRDPVKGVWEHQGREILLLDTGGIRPDAEGMDALVSRKSRDAFARAECIVLLLDVEEFTAEDEEVVASLRPFMPKVIAAVNKVDTEKRDDALGEFWALGFSQIFPVSSAHGRGCDDLADAVFATIDFPAWWTKNLPWKRKGLPWRFSENRIRANQLW